MTEQTNAYFQALEQTSNELALTDGRHRAYIAWFKSIRNQSIFSKSRYLKIIHNE